MPTITPAGRSAIDVLLVLDYQARRRTGTIVHDRVNSSDASPDVTLRTASYRSGVLQLLFPSGQSAQEAFDTLAEGLPFTFDHEERPEWAMYAVLDDGDLEITIQEGAQVFLVRVPFQEIAA